MYPAASPLSPLSLPAESILVEQQRLAGNFVEYDGIDCRTTQLPPAGPEYVERCAVHVAYIPIFILTTVPTSVSISLVAFCTSESIFDLSSIAPSDLNT